MTEDFRLSNKRHLPAIAMLATVFFTLTFFFTSMIKNTEAAVMDQLTIAGIGLNTSVKEVKLENSQLIAPEQIAGVYKPSKNLSFVIGHSTTVFKDLKNVTGNMSIIYSGINYKISEIVYMQKSDINMRDLLAPKDKKTLILMTCAGEQIKDKDYTHRLIITAEAV